MADQPPLLNFPGNGHFVADGAANRLNQINPPLLPVNADNSATNEFGSNVKLEAFSDPWFLHLPSVEIGNTHQSAHQVHVVELKLLVNLRQKPFETQNLLF